MGQQEIVGPPAEYFFERRSGGIMDRNYPSHGHGHETIPYRFRSGVALSFAIASPWLAVALRTHGFEVEHHRLTRLHEQAISFDHAVDWRVDIQPCAVS